jgi:betaine lipid synthase
MASLTPNILRIEDPHFQIYITGAVILLLVGGIFASKFLSSGKEDAENPSTLTSFLRFFYASFLKPQ